MHRYDFLVIGSGPAGQRAAIQAAKLGRKTAIIERKSSIGGASLHTGTIPSKTLREAVLYLTGWNQRTLYGRNYRLKHRITVDDLLRRLEITIQHEGDVMRHQLSRNGVEVINASASFEDEHVLMLAQPDGQKNRVYGEKILIATGTGPSRPDWVPFDDEVIVDSDQILNLKKLPRSMIVVGGGIIGVEYASIFSMLDVKTTLVDDQEHLMEFLDVEISDHLKHELRDAHGICLRLNEQVVEINKDDKGNVITKLDSGKQIVSDFALIAAGRTALTKKLELQNIGLAADENGRLSVNDSYQTQVPHIYAAGDVIGFPNLASTAMEQGRQAACHAFAEKGECAVTSHYPFAIYSVPEISMIGATELGLTEQKIPYEIGVCRLRETARGQIAGVNSGMLKLIFSTNNSRLLGVHIIGEGASELLHIGQVVMTLGGTVEYFLDNVFNYPTLAEAYKVAALDAYNRMTL